MWGFVIVLFLFTLAYSVLILVYRYWYARIVKFEQPATVLATTSFSIVIPARNEANIISACLSSLQLQQYPNELFEIIVVNDHSTDNTAALVEQWKQKLPNLNLINLKDFLEGKKINAYKKKAIEVAVLQAKGDWIVTTDADCVASPKWLALLDAYIQQKDPVLVAAPVMFNNEPTLIGQFQLLDFMSLQGITAAAVGAGYHSMCNGANLAYRKDAFNTVGKFAGIDNVASGDDMLLMYKMQLQYPGRMGFLFHEEVIMYTAPVYTWKDFFQQRIRWASKASAYADRSIFKVLLLVYLFNALLLLGFIIGIFNPTIFLASIIALITKTVVEWVFMYAIAVFFSTRQSLIWFPFFQPMHIVYTVIAGWLGKFGSYKWKQRQVH